MEDISLNSNGLVKDRMKELFVEEEGLVHISNVRSLACQEEGKFGWERGYGYQVLAEGGMEEGVKDVYYVFDTHNQNAFAHWVFENFVYLHHFFEIKQAFPRCKIVIYEKKDYKYLFLCSNGVAREDIVDASEIDFQYQTLAKEPLTVKDSGANLVFVHPYLSLNNKTLSDFHLRAIASYHKEIRALSKEKTIPILYLPRGSKENFQGLDRQYVIQDSLKEFVLGVGGTVFYTDENTDYKKQVEIVRSAKIILCDYGSNLWVNGFFSEDAHIVFLNIGWRQEYIYPYYTYLYSLIHDSNKSMTNILPHRTDESVKPTRVYHSLPEVVQHLTILLNTT